jgi:hypothetical protein
VDTFPDQVAARTPSTAGTSGSFWAERQPQRWWSWWHLPELAAVFAIGLCLMNFMYAGTGGMLGDEIAVPGHDSYYHVKMAVLLPEIGLAHEFPWLRHAYFTEETDEFVSHHYGFHVLLAPFVHAAKWLCDDYLVGARWAIATFFAASLTLFQLILMTQRIRCRWLWLALYLLMPSQFFSRHAFVRAIAPSLLFMLLIMVFMFRRRYALAGLAVAGYTHLYFGGVIFAPLIVVCYALAGLVGPQGDRVSWRLWVWTLGGWVVGVLTHPYFGGMFEFLRLQVFGTGISPDISVGREWKSYENVWWVANMCGGTLIPCALALAVRLRRGPSANAKELSVLLVSFVFAALMFKSRRFVEYWPPFALLSAVLLGGPVLDDVYAGLTSRLRGRRDRWLAAVTGVGLAGLCLAAGVLAWRVGPALRLGALTDEWRLWALLAGAYLLGPLARFWIATGPGILPGPYAMSWRVVDMLAVPAAGAAAIAAVIGVFALASSSLPTEQPRFLVPWWSFALLGVGYVIASLLARLGGQRRTMRLTWMRPAGMAAIVAGGTVLFAALTLGAGGQVVRLQRSLRGKFDLPAIGEAMALLSANSPQNSVVFTDDWDVFPVYFYVNHHNHYCVGLDPKFTHERDPVLWERYKLVTRGKTPAQYKVPTDQRRYSDGEKQVPVRIEDIREHFGAQYVIVDTDHKPFRRKLDRASTFCQRIYPPPTDHEPQVDTKDRTKPDEPPYVIYRVFSKQEQEVAEKNSQGARRGKTGSPKEWRLEDASAQSPRTPSPPTSQPSAQ